MVQHITKIDPSSRISLSKKILKLLKVEKGDYVIIRDENGKIIIYKASIGIELPTKEKD